MTVRRERRHRSDLAGDGRNLFRWRGWFRRGRRRRNGTSQDGPTNEGDEFDVTCILLRNIDTVIGAARQSTGSLFVVNPGADGLASKTFSLISTRPTMIPALSIRQAGITFSCPRKSSSMVERRAT